MQILEKCMEDMKAVYKLNEEKLDFNKKVLRERKSVNSTISKQLNYRKRRYEETVRKVYQRYKADRKHFQQ